MNIKNTKYQKVHEYIKNAWISAVKKKDCDKNFIMPYDYIPPCVDGELINLYYWDTYFTNIGLYLDGLDGYAFGNIENLKYCLRKFGCVPNMCRANGADYSSQPPLLSAMVADYYKRSRDILFLEDSYNALNIEYEFWQTRRMAVNGLNKYGTNKDEPLSYLSSFEDLKKRVNIDDGNWTDEDKIKYVKKRTGEGESGEDHTPRFGGAADNIAPIDLNCYLYGFEKNMEQFSKILKNGEEKFWDKVSKERIKKINKDCFDKEKGVYFDYNFVLRQRTNIYCVACYLPYIMGITKDSESIKKINEKLILPHGITSCERQKQCKEIYQWGYPNVWAPHNYYACIANEIAGNREIAEEIALKYLTVVADEFSISGKLYEKYDGINGGKAVINEYVLPEMLGWTAGVYQYFYNKFL